MTFVPPLTPHPPNWTFQMPVEVQAPQHTDARGFDANSSAFHQAQQNHEVLRGSDQVAVAHPLAFQQGLNQQQQPTAQRQTAQQYSKPIGQKQQQAPNFEGLPTTQVAGSTLAPTPSQQVADAAHSTLCASNCPPFSSKFDSPPIFPQRTDGGGGGDHTQYSPGFFYPYGPEGANYSSAHPNANTSGGGSSQSRILASQRLP